MSVIDENKAFFANLFSELDPCLKDLSKDLSSLYNTKWRSDVTFVLRGITVKCHKAILSARCPVLAKEFDKVYSPNKNTINIIDVECSIIDLILKYLYSGDLSQLTFVNLPLGLLYDLAANFGLDTLQNFLASQLITEQCSPDHSLIRIKVTACPLSQCRAYLMHNIRYVSKSAEVGLDKWYACVYVSQHTISKQVISVSVGRKSRRNITHLVSMNISLLDAVGKECFPFTNEFIYKTDREFGSSQFVDGQTLLENRMLYLPLDSLTVVIKLDITYHAYDANPYRYGVFRICNPETHRQHYFEGFKTLSDNLHSLYDKKVLVDLTFSYENYVLRAHQCILLGRTSVFSQMLEMLLHDLNPEVVESFVKFMYSGKRLYLLRHAYVIYDIVSRLRLMSLKSKYSKYLSCILSASTAVPILVKSFLNNDKELKYRALHFIQENGSQCTQMLNQLMPDKPEIALQVDHYLHEKSQLSKSKFHP